jgi:hypothetical protein
LLKLVDTQVEEGSLVKFMAKITGYPKPRVSWFVNQTTAISVNYKKNLFKIFKINFFFQFQGCKI